MKAIFIYMLLGNRP